MATGFVVIGWKLVVFVASSAFTTLGVYLLARFTHTFDAYGGERAKLLAQFQNLDKLVEQAQKLTTTTEAIKAQISDEVWDRQWRQGQKLKIYSQILQAINEYSIWLSDVSEGRKFGSASSPLSTMRKDPAQVAEDFHAAYAIAPLFLSENSLELLEAAKPAFSYHSSPIPDYDVEDADKKWDLLKGVRRGLSSSAKLDLHSELQAG
jgi:hypothetical protein